MGRRELLSLLRTARVNPEGALARSPHLGRSERLTLSLTGARPGDGAAAAFKARFRGRVSV